MVHCTTGITTNTDYWLIPHFRTTAKVMLSLSNAIAGTADRFTLMQELEHTPAYSHASRSVLGAKVLGVADRSNSGRPKPTASAYDAPALTDGTELERSRFIQPVGAAADAYATAS